MQFSAPRVKAGPVWGGGQGGQGGQGGGQGGPAQFMASVYGFTGHLSGTALDASAKIIRN